MEQKMNGLASVCMGLMGVVAQGAEVYAYVGCNVNEQNEGIHVVKVNTETGTLQPVWVLSGVSGTTYFAINKATTFLYTAQADPSLPSGKNGMIACYRIMGERLVQVNHVTLGSGTPCHVATDNQEQAVVWADYGNAIAGICEIRPDGALATHAPMTIQHEGHGPDPVRQEKAHAHCALLTPDHRHLGIVDLGLDQVRFYDSEKRQQGLREVQALRITTAPGAGPRHLTFHPNGTWLFLLNELDNTVSTYAYTGDAVTPVGTWPTLPEDFKAFSKASAIKINSDGTLLFTGNRGHDSIATFSVNATTGQLTQLACSKLKGRFPRDFALMPGEKFMLVGHKMSNEIQAYSLNRMTGVLTPVNDPLPIPRPLCFVFGASRTALR